LRLKMPQDSTTAAINERSGLILVSDHLLFG